MRQRMLWLAVAILGATSLGEAYYVYSRQRRPEPPAPSFEDWFATPDPLADLDRLFAPPPWAAALNRRAAGALETRTEVADDAVIVAVKIPGMRGESLDVKVERGVIRLSYAVREEAAGASFWRRYERLMPVPFEADAGTSRIETSGEEVRLVFGRRRPRADA